MSILYVPEIDFCGILKKKKKKKSLYMFIKDIDAYIYTYTSIRTYHLLRLDLIFSTILV